MLLTIDGKKSIGDYGGRGGMADGHIRRAAKCSFRVHSNALRYARLETGPTQVLGRSLIVATALAALLLGGCRTTQPSSFPGSLNSSRPDERVRAAKQAVDYPYESSADRFTAIELLVGRLDDEDEAVRFFAILALEKMTGARLGYEYHGSVYERLRAIDSWRRYLDVQAKVANKGDKGDVSGVARPAAKSGQRDVGGGLPP